MKAGWDGKHKAPIPRKKTLKSQAEEIDITKNFTYTNTYFFPVFEDEVSGYLEM